MSIQRNILRRIGLAALALVLPPHCPGCDAEIGEAGVLCAACFARASFVLDPCCGRCATPFASDGEAGARLICLNCEAIAPAWDEARAAFVYDGFSRSLILPLKYADRTENARVLGTHMARAGANLLEDADCVIPVPLHRWRLLSRRYNQSALLARAALKAGGLERGRLLVDGLLRHRPTRKLAHRNAAERLAEIADAIVVNPARAARLAGASVVLIDDVLTTGATASACARALKAAGAASVGLLVAARTTQPAERESAMRGMRFG